MVYLGADHGGFTLKEKIKEWLAELNIAYEDCGAMTLNPADDYPDFAKDVAQKVAQSPENRGILVCRSGGGMAIAANRNPKVRAVEAHDEKSAIHARTDNDANIITLSADWIPDDVARKVVELFFETDFSHEERHERRIEKLS